MITANWVEMILLLTCWSRKGEDYVLSVEIWMIWMPLMRVWRLTWNWLIRIVYTLRKKNGNKKTIISHRNIKKHWTCSTQQISLVKYTNIWYFSRSSTFRCHLLQLCWIRWSLSLFSENLPFIRRPKYCSVASQIFMLDW